MNFCWITLNVNNMEESLKFYHELLGVKIQERFSFGEEMEIAMLGEADKPKIELICNKGNMAPNKTKGISIGFEVDSLEEAMKKMESKNIAIIRGPISPSPKVSFFFISDPNGVEIQLIEHK